MKKYLVLIGCCFFLASCASLQEAVDVASDGIILAGGGIEKALAKKECKFTDANNKPYFSVSPATVLQGETVTVLACYPVHTTGSTLVREYRYIKGQNGSIDVLKDERVRRKPGYWTSKFDFDVPLSINPGRYTLIQVITYKGLKFEKKKRIIIYKKKS